MYRFSIELTNHCNFKCKFCPHSVYREESPSGNVYSREKGYMSEELFDKCMDNAQVYAKEITFGFFGEQLLHPRFSEFIGKIPDKRKYKLILNSNWSLVGKHLHPILKKFDCIKISLDSPVHSLYKELCPGPVDYASQALRIQDWLKVKVRPRTELIYVTSSLNKDVREKFLSVWRERICPGDVISVKSVISYGGVMADSYMTKARCTIVRSREKRITIAWNGDCSPCNLDVDMAINIGNLNKAKDLGVILKSEKYAKAMQGIRLKSGICVNCFDSNNRSDTKQYRGR